MEFCEYNNEYFGMSLVSISSCEGVKVIFMVYNDISLDFLRIDSYQPIAMRGTLLIYRFIATYCKQFWIYFEYIAKI